MALTAEQIQETKVAFDKHGGNKAKAALELGLTRSAFQHRLDRMAQGVEAGAAVDLSGMTREERRKELFSGNVVPLSKPKYKVPYIRGVAAEPANDAKWQSDEAIRVCVIGDLHVAPGQDLSRLKWIARHIGETQPDHIVQIGDWSDFDSVSTHDPLGSVTNKHKPSLRQDMDAHHESLHVFDHELGPSTIPRLVTLGNHCDRVRRYEELRCELEGSVWTEVLQSFAQFRWKTFAFGEVAFIGQTGFVHVPMNRMGKAHSSPNIIGNALSHDLVYGHTHLGGWWPFPKVGENAGITLINVATSYLHGRIKPYAKLSQTGWRWGLTELTLRDGRIDDFAFTSMRSLEAKYG